jgi:hypothetical protein
VARLASDVADRKADIDRLLRMEQMLSGRLIADLLVGDLPPYESFWRAIIVTSICTHDRRLMSRVCHADWPTVKRHCESMEKA